MGRARASRRGSGVAASRARPLESRDRLRQRVQARRGCEPGGPLAAFALSGIRDLRASQRTPSHGGRSVPPLRRAAHEQDRPSWRGRATRQILPRARLRARPARCPGARVRNAAGVARNRPRLAQRAPRDRLPSRPSPRHGSARLPFGTAPQAGNAAPAGLAACLGRRVLCLQERKKPASRPLAPVQPGRPCRVATRSRAPAQGPGRLGPAPSQPSKPSDGTGLQAG